MTLYRRSELDEGHPLAVEYRQAMSEWVTRMLRVHRLYNRSASMHVIVKAAVEQDKAGQLCERAGLALEAAESQARECREQRRLSPGSSPSP